MQRSRRRLVAVAAGGMIGSAIRWALVEATPVDRVETTVFAINVAGSLLLGLLLGRRERLSAEAFAGLGTGFAGGLTTFSTYALSVAQRLDDGAIATAAIGGLGTPMAALVGAGLGFRASRQLGGRGRRRGPGRGRGRPGRTGHRRSPLAGRRGDPR